MQPQIQPFWATPTQASVARTPYTPQRHGMSQSQSSRIEIPPLACIRNIMDEERERWRLEQLDKGIGQYCIDLGQKRDPLK